MEAEIRRDERQHVRHYSSRPRHTMELDYYVYEYDLRKRVVPAGQARRAGGGMNGPRPVASSPLAIGCA